VSPCKRQHHAGFAAGSTYSLASASTSVGYDDSGSRRLKPLDARINGTPEGVPSLENGL
jgi:hypothetical protein